MSFESYLAAAGILLVLSVFANQISGRFGIPSLLLLLGLGMFAGSFGQLDIVGDRLTNHIGTIALIFILFNGGLLTSWKTVRSTSVIPSDKSAAQSSPIRTRAG